MNKRENLLWQIILIIASFAIIYNGYILYNMNNEFTALWEKYEKEDIGTDKKLQNKVERLEKSLRDKKEFKFKMKRNPSDLSAVIDFKGLNSMGIFRHFKLETIFYSKKLLNITTTTLYYQPQTLTNTMVSMYQKITPLNF